MSLTHVGVEEAFKFFYSQIILIHQHIFEIARLDNPEDSSYNLCITELLLQAFFNLVANTVLADI